MPSIVPATYTENKPNRNPFRSHITYIPYPHFQQLNTKLATMPKADVVICGSGSAGLCAATWLARYGLKCTILERRPGPMKMGQADGVQCRTVEIFESFDLAQDLLREAYHVLEVVFWADQDGGIARTGRTADTQPGLSHQPHVILNQARMNGLLIETMQRFNAQDVEYGVDVRHVRVDSATARDPEAYPVTVTAERDGRQEVYHAKYALVCISSRHNDAC